MRTDHAQWVSAASATGATNWRVRSRRLTARTVAVQREVADVLGTGVALPVVDAVRPWGLPGVVLGLTRACIDALREGPDGTEADGHGVIPVLAVLRALRAELDEFDAYTRSWRLQRCEGALQTMRASASPTGTVEHACRALVRSCGFERAMLSRLEGDLWMPYSGYVSGDDSLEEWTATWVGRRIRLDAGSVEDDACRTRTAIIAPIGGPRITRTPGAPGHPITAAYVVAPITDRAGRVMGLLHADQAPTDRDICAVDRDILQCFAEGLSQIYVRTVLSEALRSQAVHVRETFTATNRMLSEIGDAPIRFGSHAPGMHAVAGSDPLTPDASIVADLTDRERDVLDLMLVGARNPAIADQLVISAATVKFHVRNILRKLGASNRTQAIATCLGNRDAGPTVLR